MEKMKQIKKNRIVDNLLLIMLTTLVLVATTTFTMAWFSASDTASNSDLILGEPINLEIETEGDGHFAVQVAGSELLPGMEVAPSLKVTFDASTTPALLRARISTSFAGGPVANTLQQDLQTSLENELTNAWVAYGDWFYFIGNASTSTYVMTRTMEGVGGLGGTTLIAESDAEYVVSSNRVAATPVEDTVLGSIYPGASTKEIWFFNPSSQSFRLPTSLTDEYAGGTLTFDFEVQAVQDLLLDEEESNTVLPTIDNAQIAFSSLAMGEWFETSDFSSYSLSGAGSQASPYQIASSTDLSYLSYLLDETNNASTSGYSSNPTDGVYYQLTSDIDLGANYWTPIGTGSGGSNTSFAGFFDGNDHTISNMTIDKTFDTYDLTKNVVGLFGVTELTTSVSNLTMSNIDLTTNKAAMVASLGGIPNANNVTASGTINATNTSIIGGILGVNMVSGSDTTKLTSYVTINVNVNETLDDLGNLVSVGGVIGVISPMTTATIGNFANYGNIVLNATLALGNDYMVGGFSGIVMGQTTANLTIENAMNVGNITVTADSATMSGVGGIIAMGFNSEMNLTALNYTYNTGSISASGGISSAPISTMANPTSSYYLDTSIASGSYVGTSATSAQMQAQGTYSGWNFTTIWQIAGGTNNGYPTLRD